MFFLRADIDKHFEPNLDPGGHFPTKLLSESYPTNFLAEKAPSEGSITIGASPYQLRCGMGRGAKVCGRIEKSERTQDVVRLGLVLVGFLNHQGRPDPEEF